MVVLAVVLVVAWSLQVVPYSPQWGEVAVGLVQGTLDVGFSPWLR